MHDTITAVVESAHHDHDRRTEIDTGMAQLDETHRRHAASRLRECFRELWGHEVIVTFPGSKGEQTFCAACGTALKDAHSRYMTPSGPVHEWCHTKRVA